MKKYQCFNIPSVVNKLKELNVAINTKEDSEYIKGFCRYVRNLKGSKNDNLDYYTRDDKDISIYLEYDTKERNFYVGVED
ncbi:MAG: hypothetical protein ACRCVJ_18760 [Clostridium sp.]|uniref:hypothetical protein n=1 Tax=Clostridium sp. TaxID=1506 RepID=UPI003F2E6CD5